MYVSCYSLNSPLLPQTVENLPAMQDTQVRPLGQDRSPGEGKDNPPQRSCLERPVDRGAWLPQSLGSRRIKDNRVTTFLSIHVTTDFCYYFLKISLSLSLSLFSEENPKYSNGRLDNEYKQSSQTNYKRERREFPSGSEAKTLLS